MHSCILFINLQYHFPQVIELDVDLLPDSAEICSILVQENANIGVWFNVGVSSVINIRYSVSANNIRVKYKLPFKKRNLRRKGGIYVKLFLPVSQFSQLSLVRLG